MANGLRPFDILTPIQQGIGIATGAQQLRERQGLAPLQQQLLGLQLQQGQFDLQRAREQQRLQSVVSGAVQALSVPPNQRLAFLQQRREQLVQQGLPTMDTDEALELARAGDQEGLQRVLEQTVNVGTQLGLLKSPGGAAARTFAPVEVTDPVTGERRLGIPTIDPQTLETSFEQVPLGAEFQLAKETAAQQRAAELEAAEQKERAKLLAKQRQDIKTEITTNAREARRQLPRIDRLLSALDQVQTGRIAQAKAILGPFIPGVDPSDEQALAAAMNDLIFDQLARFTGAISEGERAFAERTSANLGFTNQANRIILERLKSRLDDAVTEQKQFSDFLQGGGNEEDFEFSPTQLPIPAADRPLFSRVLNREVTEQDIQDTLQANPGVTRAQLLQQLGIERTGQQPVILEIPQ